MEKESTDYKKFKLQFNMNYKKNPVVEKDLKPTCLAPKIVSGIWRLVWQQE